MNVGALAKSALSIVTCPKFESVSQGSEDFDHGESESRKPFCREAMKFTYKISIVSWLDA